MGGAPSDHRGPPGPPGLRRKGRAPLVRPHRGAPIPAAPGVFLILEDEMPPGGFLPETLPRSCEAPYAVWHERSSVISRGPSAAGSPQRRPGPALLGGSGQGLPPGLGGGDAPTAARRGRRVRPGCRPPLRRFLSVFRARRRIGVILGGSVRLLSGCGGAGKTTRAAPAAARARPWRLRPRISGYRGLPQHRTSSGRRLPPHCARGRLRRRLRGGRRPEAEDRRADEVLPRSP